MLRILLIILGCTAGLFAQQQLNFIACPIVRDTKTVPCYLAEYNGETYYLGAQGDSHAPQLKHEVLVEGNVAPGPRVCGGVPLRPVSISVIKEVNAACNTLLPAEPGIEAPVSSTEPKAQGLMIQYSFDDDKIDATGERVVTEAAAEAKRSGAKSVTVTGHQAVVTLSDGKTLTEKPGLALKRAEQVATLLRGLGVSNVKVEAKAVPSDRHVTIAVSE